MTSPATRRHHVTSVTAPVFAVTIPQTPIHRPKKEFTYLSGNPLGRYIVYTLW